MTNLRVRDAAQEQVSLADVYESELTLDDLKLLVKVTGLKNPGQLKSQKAASMATAMSGEALQALWSRLDNTQQLAVAETLHSAAPQFDKSRFTAKYDKAPLWSTDGKSSYNWRSSPSLLCAFLIGPKRILPSELRDRLLAFVDEPEPMATGGTNALPPTYERTTTDYDRTNRSHVAVTDQIPISVHVREHAAQRELLSVLRLIDAGKISVSDKTKKPTGASITAITNTIGGDFYAPLNDNENEQRDEPGAIRAFAWPMLVQAAGLAKPSPTKLTLTKTGRAALDRPAAEALRDIWNRWLNTKLFDELARIDAVKGQNGKARRGLSQAVDRRALVQKRLRDCDPGEWLETKFILRFLKSAGAMPSVVRTEMAAWSLYIGDPQYGSLGYDGYLEPVNERYVLCLLLEYAATLGLIDVGLIPPDMTDGDDIRDLWGTDDLGFLSRYDGLLYLRINPLGAYCFGQQATYVPSIEAQPPTSSAPSFKVLPTGDIIATGTAPPTDDVIALDTYAVRTNDAVWHLDDTQLLTCIEQGRSIDEIRRFLARASATPLPATVEYLLDDIERRAGQVRPAGTARLLECKDHALAQRIANDAATRKYCMLTGSHHLAVPVTTETSFLRGLRKIGYTIAP